MNTVRRTPILRIHNGHVYNLHKNSLAVQRRFIVINQQNIAEDSANKVMQFPSMPGAPADPSDIARIVERLIDARRSRRSYFPASLFADPAWEILLILALAEARHHRLTVSNVCNNIEAPATTALRWIKTLTETGLIVRRDDANDMRRKYLELSDTAYAKMVEYCSSFNAPVQLAA